MPGPQPAASDAWSRAEAGCFDLAAVLAIVAMPMAMGGRHPLGQAILTAAAVAAIASWTIRACRGDGTWRFGLPDALALAGLAIGSLQVLPLPRAWIEAISPRLLPLLPCLDGGPRSFGGWDQLSLAPGETVACLQILLAQAVFAGVLVQRIRSVADAERILGVVACATGLLAALGIVQYVAGNGRYLWLYEFAHNDAGGVVKGTFTNRNHFAGFLAIGAGTVLARAIAGSPASRGGGHDRDRIGGWLLLAVVVFAAVSSLSRGGCLAALVGIVVGFCCLARSAAWRISALVGLAAAGCLVAVALGIHGWDRVVGRFGDFRDGGPASAGHGRLAVWKAACRTITDFPWLGTGAGSHGEVAPLFMPPTGETLFTHAENSFLNVGVETGLVGLAVAVTAVAAAVVAAIAVVGRGDDRERRVGAAAASGLAAGAVHGLADFTWCVPACSTLLVVLGCCGVALARRRVAWLPSFELRLGRHASAVAGAGVALLLCGGAVRQIAAARAELSWEDSVRLAREAETAAEPARRLEALDPRIASLERCVALRPDHPRARTDLALARLERFGLARLVSGKSLGLMDFRMAAGKGGFASHAELVAWVRRAAEPHASDLELALGDAMDGIQIGPLSGEAWCVLAQLAFLAGRPEASAELVAQAVRVRPSSSLVLFEAANQAALDGDPERAAGFWRASFAADRRQRARIIAVLLPTLASAEACELLEPDLDGLRAMETAWSARETAEELEPVRELLSAALVAKAGRDGTPPAVAGRLFLEAALVEQRRGRTAESRTLLASALLVDPSSYDTHRAAADAAIAAEDWTAARREIEWCLLRRPDSQELLGKLGKLRASGGRGATDAAAMPATATKKR